MKRILKKENRGIALFICVVTSFMFWLSVTYKPTSPHVFREYMSPDRKFKIVVYGFGSLLPTMPGQGSDGPGEVRLCRIGNGKALKRKRIDMVQIVDDVTWSPTNVYIKSVAEWDLPSP